MPTFFGYRCALLHPYFMNTDISFAAIAVLKKPVIWGENSEGEEIPVRVVFLVSLAEGELYKIQSFYESISDFVVNADKVEELIRHPNLETLKKMYAK